MLSVGAVSIGIRVAGLLPTQVSALGISLSITDQVWLIRFLYLGIGYLLVKFAICATMDFFAWEENLKYRIATFLNDYAGNVNLKDRIADTLHNSRPILRADPLRLKVLMEQYVEGQLGSVALICGSSWLAAARLLLDLALPALVGPVAVVVLLTWDVGTVPRHDATLQAGSQLQQEQVVRAPEGTPKSVAPRARVAGR
ncbi:MAG TPA: hypothetical protein VN428_11935 [Bryobacteraceae bacterium]|nr:hypothetical protein [Bryobacteraceae bacterium]